MAKSQMPPEFYDELELHLPPEQPVGRPRVSHRVMGKARWVVERTINWIKGLRRMRRRYDRLMII